MWLRILIVLLGRDYVRMRIFSYVWQRRIENCTSWERALWIHNKLYGARKYTNKLARESFKKLCELLSAATDSAISIEYTLGHLGSVEYYEKRKRKDLARSKQLIRLWLKCSKTSADRLRLKSYLEKAFGGTREAHLHSETYRTLVERDSL
jgi:hypothetical protein